MKNNIKMWAQRQKHLSPQHKFIFIFKCVWNGLTTTMRRRWLWLWLRLELPMHYEHRTMSSSIAWNGARMATDSNKCTMVRERSQPAVADTRYHTNGEQRTRDAQVAINVDIQWIFHGEFYFKFNYTLHRNHCRAQSSSSSSWARLWLPTYSWTAESGECAPATSDSRQATEGNEMEKNAAKLYNLFFINNNKLYERMRSFGKTATTTTGTAAAAAITELTEHRAQNNRMNRKRK